MYQKPLDDKYLDMGSVEAEELIRARKAELGDKVVLLGHHYQNDAIIQFADFAGDSLELSRIAAKQNAEYIVFCGVHFMAESADILTGAGQKVLLPDMTAGCSMADMADIDQVESCWEDLTARLTGKEIVPITYVNSTAAIKAFCGARGGLCATSGNCREVFEWVWGQKPDAVILFMPDEHLGRNTAYGMGVSLDEMSLWDPFAAEGGGIDAEQLTRSKILLWKGYCSVHQEFSREHVERWRREEPGVKVIVHPECCFEVAQAADELGSTARIIKVLRSAERGSVWAVGTESNLVNRLAKELAAKGVKVGSLSSCSCLCETMYRINLPHLAWVMDMLGRHVAEPGKYALENQVVVDEETKKQARLALERMLMVK